MPPSADFDDYDSGRMQAESEAMDIVRREASAEERHRIADWLEQRAAAHQQTARLSAHADQRWERSLATYCRKLAQRVREGDLT